MRYGASFRRYTLRQLVRAVLKERLGCNEPCIDVGDSGLYAEGEDEDHIEKRFSEFPASCVITDKTRITVDDFTQVHPPPSTSPAPLAPLPPRTTPAVGRR